MRWWNVSDFASCILREWKLLSILKWRRRCSCWMSMGGAQVGGSMTEGEARCLIRQVVIVSLLIIVIIQKISTGVIHFIIQNITGSTVFDNGSTVISGRQGWQWEDWLLRVQQVVDRHQGGGRGWIDQVFLVILYFDCSPHALIGAFDQKEEQEIREEFLKLDTDQSGFITKGESSFLPSDWYQDFPNNCAKL